MPLKALQRTRSIATLGRLLISHPVEFYDRVMTLLELYFERLWVRSPGYQPVHWDEMILSLQAALKEGIVRILHEAALTDIELKVRRRMDEIKKQAPFPLAYSGDWQLAILCYVMCRAIKPLVVLETGVAYGVTSAFILQALEVNGYGMLHSVDLPPLGDYKGKSIGVLVPEGLKNRWQLHRGVSRRVLPRLLPQLGQINIFVHDSLHTEGNMRKEFELVTPYLASPSVVIADDVEGNRAFLDYARQRSAVFSAVIQGREKPSLLGIIVFS